VTQDGLPILLLVLIILHVLDLLYLHEFVSTQENLSILRPFALRIFLAPQKGKTNFHFSRIRGTSIETLIGNLDSFFVVSEGTQVLG